MYPSKRHYLPSSKKPATSKERIIGIIAAISFLAAAVAAFPLILLVSILFVLLLIVWLLLPLPIPLPPFRSRLMRALLRALREEAAAQTVRAPIEIRELPEFFPPGRNVKDAEKLLLKEGFKPFAVRSLDAKEAAARGAQACRCHEYSRLTHVHPLWSIEWDIYLFVDGNGSICAFRERRFIGPYAQCRGPFRRWWNAQRGRHHAA